MLVATSCSEDVLDQKPVDSFDQESVFSDLGITKAFLGTCYDRMYGSTNERNIPYTSRNREDLISSGTDECFCIHRPTEYSWLKGNLSADDVSRPGQAYFGDRRRNYSSYAVWEYIYNNIQNVNLLLANIDDVPTTSPADEADIKQIKGEAYFIRAMMYGNLWLVYGGLVITEAPFELGQDYLTIQRSTLEETLNFILGDIQKAMDNLPADMEQGRANVAACAALKARLLHFASGDLVNGKLAFTASDPLVCFQGGSQTTRIQASRDAQKAIMDGTYGTFSLVGTTADPPNPMTQADIDAYADNFFKIFIQKGQWSSETIYATQYTASGTGGNYSRVNIWFGPNGYHNWGNNDPTEPAVRKFEMADGTPFVWDNGEGEELRTATAAEIAADPTENPYNGREPRFYATVLFHGAPWGQRPPDAAGIDPSNRIQTGHYYDPGTGERISAGLDTRQGLIEAWNGTKNGYYLKKFTDPMVQGQYFYNENYYIEFRYAEVLLNYAEACIELGGADLQNGLDALNMVRNRAGLPDRVTADMATARDYLRQEKFTELYAEGERWWDLRRWLMFDQVVENVCEMKIKEYSNGDMEWFYDTSAVADQREWQGDEAYWIPIPTDEINKAPQLQQNPGY
jgi:hypothetical protein